jgi:vacuolar-type H+-ATPase subunit I/STV1
MTKKNKFFAELKKENNIKKFNVKEVKLNRIQDIRDILSFESSFNDALGYLDDIEAAADNFYNAYKTIDTQLTDAELELAKTINELADLGVQETPEIIELQQRIDDRFQDLFELEDRGRFFNITLK